MKPLFFAVMALGACWVLSMNKTVAVPEEPPTAESQRPGLAEPPPPTEVRLPAESSFEVGSELLREGNYAEALLPLRVATMLDPSLTSAWFAALEASDRLGHRDETRALAKEMVRHHPALAEDWNLRKYLED